MFPLTQHQGGEPHRGDFINAQKRPDVGSLCELSRHFCNFGFQICLPSLPQDTHLIGKDFSILPFPNKLEHLASVFYFKEDLSSEVLLKNDIAETNFEYDGPITVSETLKSQK